MSKVLCIGDACADIILPYGEALKQKDVSASFSCGGANANTAYALGKLNVDTAFAGKAGRDLYGLTMKEELRKVGVNTDHFLIDDSLVSTQILIVIDQNSDRFPFLMPKEDPSYLQIYPEDLSGIDLSDTEYILTNGMMLFDDPAASSITSFLKEARKRNITILLDINFRIETINRNRYYLDQVIEISDIVLGSIEDDFLPLTHTKNMEEALNHLDRNKIIVAHDSKGSTVYAKKDLFHCDSYKVEVKDTIGAGDAFNAGFLYGLIRHEGLDTSNRYGCAVAALSVTKSGARNGPSEEELLRFLNKN